MLYYIVPSSVRPHPTCANLIIDGSLSTRDMRRGQKPLGTNANKYVCLNGGRYTCMRKREREGGTHIKNNDYSHTVFSGG